MSEKIYLSYEGHGKLADELKELKGPKRIAVAKALERARAHGDLRENSEYDAAKEARAQLEKRIADLEDKLARAMIVDASKLSAGVVTIAKTVKLKDLDSGETVRYTLVDAEEADPPNGRISVTSPIGKALIGHKVKDKVQIQIPAGTLNYQITSIDA